MGLPFGAFSLIGVVGVLTIQNEPPGGQVRLWLVHGEESSWKPDLGQSEGPGFACLCPSSVALVDSYVASAAHSSDSPHLLSAELGAAFRALTALQMRPPRSPGAVVPTRAEGFSGREIPSGFSFVHLFASRSSEDGVLLYPLISVTSFPFCFFIGQSLILQSKYEFGELFHLR